MKKLFAIVIVLVSGGTRLLALVPIPANPHHSIAAARDHEAGRKSGDDVRDWRRPDVHHLLRRPGFGSRERVLWICAPSKLDRRLPPQVKPEQVRLEVMGPSRP